MGNIIGFFYKNLCSLVFVFHELAGWMQGCPSAMLAGMIGFPYIRMAMVPMYGTE